MSRDENIRIDKFLWAVRIFKTRSLASEECRKGRIMINNNLVKPSHIVDNDDIIEVKKLPVIHTYKVIKLTGNRIGAKLVGEFIADLTPDEENAKLLVRNIEGFGYRKRGSGRPTKKERRTIDKLKNGYNDF